MNRAENYARLKHHRTSWKFRGSPNKTEALEADDRLIWPFCLWGVGLTPGRLPECGIRHGKEDSPQSSTSSRLSHSADSKTLPESPLLRTLTPSIRKNVLLLGVQKRRAAMDVVETPSDSQYCATRTIRHPRTPDRIRSIFLIRQCALRWYEGVTVREKNNREKIKGTTARRSRACFRHILSLWRQSPTSKRYFPNGVITGEMREGQARKFPRPPYTPTEP